MSDMDNKPLLQDKPPAYNTVSGAYEYGQQQNYGAIPAAGPPPPGFQQPPPPYHYPDGQAYPAVPGQMPAVAQQPNYTNTYTIIQPSVVVVGGCPACRVGVLEDDFTCLGIMCAIFFFPIGILFCLALRQRRCPNCGATFG
ncbi:brain protein I3 [Clupea harengus]|uniref:Membrane protein BRI3 n=1 Tax=Clupea harengus TaxID=7950 RepID=A0A6P3VUH9_CLUHA|nr:brain protein I3 [Clupea harengus]